MRTIVSRFLHQDEVSTIINGKSGEIRKKGQILLCPHRGGHNNKWRISTAVPEGSTWDDENSSGESLKDNIFKLIVNKLN